MAKKLTAYLKNGENTIYLDGYIETNERSKILIKNVAVYWNYSNIKNDDNDTITVDNVAVKFDEGYWTFSMLQRKLKENNITLLRNMQDDTCTISPPDGKTVSLKNFGILLGFPKNEVVTTPIASEKVVDINLGLRYVTIGCECVDRNKNFGPYGNRRNVIATVPVTTEQSLNATVSYFKEICREVPVNNGMYNRFKFVVDTNIGRDVGMNVLVDCYVS